MLEPQKNMETIQHWSELPSELLWLIAARLNIRSDILHFRAVCRPWRKSVPFSLITGKNTILSPILPHYFSISHFEDPMTSARSFLTNRNLVLVANCVFLVQSLVNPTHPPWLVSVEEFNPAKLYIRRPFKRSVIEHLPEGFPSNLDRSYFRISEISRMYSLSYAPESDDMITDESKNRNSQRFDKVVVHFPDRCDTDTITIDDCTIMMLYNEYSIGSFGKFSFRDGVFSALTCTKTKKFDDVVNFNGKVLAIDRRGRLYRMENDRLRRIMIGFDTMGDGTSGGLGCDRKKRLIESCGELFLVYRCPEYADVAFKVYKLNDNEEHKEWEELDGIGDDRILIATQDGCFFVPSVGIMPTCGGNSLVFVRGVFPAYNNACKADLELFGSHKETPFEIAVFHFGTRKCKVLKSGFPNVMWPPPPWLSSDPLSLNRSRCLWLSRDFHKDGEVEEDSSEVGASDFIMQIQPNTTTSVKDSTSSNIATGGCNNAISKPHEDGIAKMEFQGVEVSSELVPTLTAIWDKHGNILEGSNVQSKDLVVWALESIAKVVILLKDTSIGSLNSSEAEYLSSTLCDLQMMRFNVNWLASTVAEALKFQKSMAAHRAKMEVTLKEIDNVTAHVADIKSKFLAELSSLEKTLDEQRMMICESLSAFDSLNNGISFGDGL